jgi:CBS domain containing-hemolysin-like protein
VLAISTLFLLVPLVAAFLHSLPSAIGRRWPETTIKTTVPLIARLAVLFAPVLPHGSTVRPRADLTQPQAPRPPGDAGGSDDLSLVSGVLEFTERQVREVMTPRTEVIAVAEVSSLDEISGAFVDSGFSRLPAYSDSLDNIVGMYYAFDLLKLSPGGQLPVRPVTLVPMTRPCADLLFEMQRERRQVAIVLDEYGGTAGMVTLNDLLADLVEATFEASPTTVAEPGAEQTVAEVAGTAPVSEIEQQFGVQIPGGAETVGGLLSAYLGRIPTAGERFEMAGLEFDIVAATPAKVERITVRRATVAVVRIESMGSQ